MEVLLVVTAWILAGYIGSRLMLRNELAHDDSDRIIALFFTAFGPVLLGAVLLITLPWGRIPLPMRLIRKMFP